MDLLTNFSESDRGNKHLLVVIDELTRYIEAFPIRNKTAEEVGIAFFNGFICRHGVPEVLVSDNGLEFKNRFFDTLSELMRIKKVNIQPYRPEANGVCERANRKIIEAYRVTLGGEDPNWDRWIQYIMFSVNSSVNESIGMSPNKALYGRDVRNPFDFFSGEKLKDTTADTLVRSAHDRFHSLKNKLQVSTHNMERKVNVRGTDRSVKLGDKCYIKINVRNQLNYKLGPKFDGPFEVVEKLVGNKYRVKSLENNVEKVVHISQIKVTTINQKKKVRFLV